MCVRLTERTQTVCTYCMTAFSCPALAVVKSFSMHQEHRGRLTTFHFAWSMTFKAMVCYTLQTLLEKWPCRGCAACIHHGLKNTVCRCSAGMNEALQGLDEDACRNMSRNQQHNTVMISQRLLTDIRTALSNSCSWCVSIYDNTTSFLR